MKIEASSDSVVVCDLAGKEVASLWCCEPATQSDPGIVMNLKLLHP